MRWGLIPNWWNKPLKEMKQAAFNTRAETVAIRPFFRDAFKQKCCLIPASDYYEWLNTPDRQAALLLHPLRRTAADVCRAFGMNGTSIPPLPG